MDIILIQAQCSTRQFHAISRTLRQAVGCDAKKIREYLKNRNIRDCTPYRNFKSSNKRAKQNSYNKTRYVVERFFAWLKCGFHRTRIRYERLAENYLRFLNIASFLMYWRVLG